MDVKTAFFKKGELYGARVSFKGYDFIVCHENRSEVVDMVKEMVMSFDF